MTHDLIVQQPEAGAPAQRALLLLFHGVGASAEDLLPLGRALGAALPQAWVVCVRGPDASDLGRGWQWFSVQGVTEANRPARVAATMPRFAQAVADWQRRSGVGVAATTLVGFSQGAIMALESTQASSPPGGRVVAIAGRFAQPPRQAQRATLLHLLHGEQDGVMPVVLARQAAAQWQALGGRVTIDLFDGLGHGIDARVVQRIVEHLGEPGTEVAG